MADQNYITRTLLCDDAILTEADLVRDDGVVVVLAEPGAGKTELLGNLARRCETEAQKASVFHAANSNESRDTLFLDALDEVPRQGSSTITNILVRAKKTGARKVVLSSRSSEWDPPQSEFVRSCFGTNPKIVRLSPLEVAEQEQLFVSHAPDEDYFAFSQQVRNFNLEPLLGNPQFLILFTEAYIEVGRNFSTKTHIFYAAVHRLAQEVNSAISQKQRPPIEKIVFWASEVFAKLLLSGTVGISTAEDASPGRFPFHNLLMPDGDDHVNWIIDTRLMKPSSNEKQHEPVHRIVAEYCAARYLAGRVNEPAGSLSVGQCLAVIAPNSTVRSELRGLIGWMATFGNSAIQEAIIELDPYSVLANGDPSCLSHPLKCRMLSRLRQIAETDPYFRGTDFRRTFSLDGFFTDEMIEVVRPMLLDNDQPQIFVNLLLEMLHGAGAVPQLAAAMRTLMLNEKVDQNTRLLAHQNLVKITGQDHQSDLQQLVRQDSINSLQISAHMFLEFGVDALSQDSLLNLFRSYNKSRQVSPHCWSQSFQQRVPFQKLIGSLKIPHTVWLLDQLTDSLNCTCGNEKYPFECHCRDAISKVVGHLLDRYFEVSQEPFGPETVWKWIRKLNFHDAVGASNSFSVQTLETNHELRQGIHRHVLGNVTDPEQIRHIQHYTFGGNFHAGLKFQTGDHRAIVDHAFERNNPCLWGNFLRSHNRYGSDRGPDVLRSHMRKQANEKPEFMGVWSKHNRYMMQEQEKAHRKNKRHDRRRRRQEARIQAHNLRYLYENRGRIERGQDLRWLQGVSQCRSSEEQNKWVDDPQLLDKAFSNSIRVIEKQLPPLRELAELECCGSRIVSCEEEILYPACLAVFRQSNSLSGISWHALAVLKAQFEWRSHDLDREIRERFEDELNTCLFGIEGGLEKFVDEYLEPQLRISKCKLPGVRWLDKPEFERLRNTRLLEWLKQYPEASIEALKILFDLSVRYCDRAGLVALINQRMGAISSSAVDQQETEDCRMRHDFWKIRHFLFSEELSEEVIRWLKSDRNRIFALEIYNDEWLFRSKAGIWPNLSAEKIFHILDAYVEEWPKVDLPSSWGSSSPKGEIAYRFLTTVIWMIKKDHPSKQIPVLNSIIEDDRFWDFHKAARHMREQARNEEVLLDFKPPSPSQIVQLLRDNQPASVESLRALLMEELDELQRKIKGSEFDPVDKYYSNGQRVDELTATKRIAEDLDYNLQARNISVTIERHMNKAKRCDITAARMFDGLKKLVVMEVKGQWNRDLFTAAAEQLDQRYSIHPDAANQGIYLVLWFGQEEMVADQKNHSFSSPDQLKEHIIKQMPEDLRKRIDVYVLDVSRKRESK
ncbi:MAG: hypothetical protein OXG56_12395 [Gammaproteobacteria bacterium]|nr:hypothetical protein [Gammaproteobacteria bacterium]